MIDASVWWLLAGGAVALELITGTFYLLMLAIGLAAAAISAHTGLSVSGQLITAGIVGGGAVVGWHLKRENDPQPLDANSNRDVNLDIGEDVSVVAWNKDETCSVKFRGAHWTAVAATPQDTLDVGLFTIIAVHGSRLTITNRKAPRQVDNRT